MLHQPTLRLCTARAPPCMQGPRVGAIVRPALALALGLGLAPTEGSIDSLTPTLALALAPILALTLALARRRGTREPCASHRPLLYNP
eukprot:scaffold8968_cov57-Phaeocystis_antarctica.AAC.7